MTPSDANPILFLKLGGSLITDKTKSETIRTQVLARVANEIAAARQANPDMRLVLGHGSGSFGHVAAAKYNTRTGVSGPENWRGFTEVSDAAARLNRAVVKALLAAGVSALSLSPSASAVCRDGQIESLAAGTVSAALNNRLIPVIYGDVAFDKTQGGTIISTEEVMSYLAPILAPKWLLLAGETDGVYDVAGKTIPHITQDNLPQIRDALGGSRGTDVTGGMATKVESMLALSQANHDLQIRIFSGLQANNLTKALQDPNTAQLGTRLSAHI